MYITYKGESEKQLFESSRKLKKKFGSDLAKKIMQRLSELAAADTLAMMSQLPPARCHPLKGDRKGQFAVDLKQPYRLVFEIAQIPIPCKEDGGVDMDKVEAIRVLSVEDYHG